MIARDEIERTLQIAWRDSAHAPTSHEADEQRAALTRLREHFAALALRCEEAERQSADRSAFGEHVVFCLECRKPAGPIGCAEGDRLRMIAERGVAVPCSGGCGKTAGWSAGPPYAFSWRCERCAARVVESPDTPEAP